MNELARKSVFATGSFLLALAIVWTGIQTASAQSAAAADVPKAEDVFKNIQVFKGMPADQLRPTMMFFRAALGVTCEECHPGQRELDPDKVDKSTVKPGPKPDWWYSDPTREFDTNPNKQMARTMVRMVNNINKETFGGRQVVTCFSCHRGSVKPIAVPFLDEASAAAPAAKPAAKAAAAPALPSADEVLGKFVAALGGTNAIQKITTRVAKGNMITSVLIASGAGGREAPMALEIYSKAPNMRMEVVHNQEGVIRSYVGDKGWHQDRTSNDVRHLPRADRGDELDNDRLEDPYFFALQLKDLVTGMRVERVEKVDGKDTYMVSGRTPNLPRTELFFDLESGLLVRSIAYTQTFVGRFTVQVDYSDFRAVDGVKMPFHWVSTQLMEREKYTYQIDQVQQNVPIESSQFPQPAKYLHMYTYTPKGR